jgi:hypothetical protein
MKNALPLLFAFSLLAAAGPLAAQSPAPQPPATSAPQPEPKAAERPVLNLRLDDESRRRIMSGSSAQETSRSGDALPTLGDDARKLDPTLLRGSPYPKESTSGVPAPY